MSWTIKGHTVQSDGMVYDPDSAGWGYVPSDYRAVSSENPQHAVYVAPPSKPQAAAATVSKGPGGGGAGPGSATVKNTTAARAAGSGAGSRLVVSMGEALTPSMSTKATELMVGGDWWKSNPWFSNTEEWEARYGEPGDWAGGVVVFGGDVVYNTGRFLDWGFNYDTVSNNRPDTTVVTDMRRNGSSANEVGQAFQRQGARWAQDAHRALGTGYVVPMGGF